MNQFERELKIIFKTKKDKEEYIRWLIDNDTLDSLDLTIGKKTITYNGKDEVEIG